MYSYLRYTCLVYLHIYIISMVYVFRLLYLTLPKVGESPWACRPSGRRCPVEIPLMAQSFFGIVQRFEKFEWLWMSKIEKIERIFHTYRKKSYAGGCWTNPCSSFPIQAPLTKLGTFKDRLPSRGIAGSKKAAVAGGWWSWGLVRPFKSQHHGMCGEPVSFWKGTSYKWTGLSIIINYHQLSSRLMKSD